MPGLCAQRVVLIDQVVQVSAANADHIRDFVPGQVCLQQLPNLAQHFVTDFVVRAASFVKTPGFLLSSHRCRSEARRVSAFSVEEVGRDISFTVQLVVHHVVVAVSPVLHCGKHRPKSRSQNRHVTM